MLGGDAIRDITRGVGATAAVHTAIRIGVVLRGKITDVGVKEARNARTNSERR